MVEGNHLAAGIQEGDIECKGHTEHVDRPARDKEQPLTFVERWPSE
jgi:hypothetical protein